MTVRTFERVRHELKKGVLGLPTISSLRYNECRNRYDARNKGPKKTMEQKPGCGFNRMQLPARSSLSWYCLFRGQ